MNKDIYSKELRREIERLEDKSPEYIQVAFETADYILDIPPMWRTKLARLVYRAAQELLLEQTETKEEKQ